MSGGQSEMRRLVRSWIVIWAINPVYDSLPAINCVCCQRKLGLLTSSDWTRGRKQSFLLQAEGKVLLNKEQLNISYKKECSGDLMPLSVWLSKAFLWLFERNSVLFVYLLHLCNYKLDWRQILFRWLIPLNHWGSNGFLSHSKEVIFDVFSEMRTKEVFLYAYLALND